MHEKYSRQQLSSSLLSAGLCGELYVHSPNVISLQSPPLEKKKVGRVWLEVVSFICHPGLFDLPPYGTLLNEDESCINTGGHREMPSHTQIHARKVKKNCERDKKQTGARNSRNTNPTETHIHPSIS